MDNLTAEELIEILKKMSPDTVVGRKHTEGIDVNFGGITNILNIRSWDHPSVDGQSGKSFTIEVTLSELKMLHLHLGEHTFDKLKSTLIKTMTNDYWNGLNWKDVNDE